MVSGIGIHSYVYVCVHDWITITHNHYVDAIFYTPLQVERVVYGRSYLITWDSLLAASQASLELLSPHDTATCRARRLRTGIRIRT